MRNLAKKFPKKQLYLLITFLTITLVSGIIFLKSGNKKQQDLSEAKVDTGLDASAEAKLKEYYQEEKKVELKNFSPRYSVFENGIIGYKFSYPVGFNVEPADNNAQISQVNGAGKILVKEDKKFEVIIQNGEGLTSAADFIRSTFKFIAPATYDKSKLEERFSEGNEDLGKY